MKRVIAALAVVALLAVASAASAQRNPRARWSYGPRGSCYIHGWIPGYKEYFYGRYVACVRQ